MDYLSAFQEFLTSGKKPASKATLKNYKTDIKHFLDWFKKEFGHEFTPSEISPQNLLMFKQKLIDDGSAASTAQRHLSSIHTFTKFLKEKGLLKTALPSGPTAKSQEPTADLWYLKDFKDYLYLFGTKNTTIKNYLMDLEQFFDWIEKAEPETFDVSSEYRATRLPVLFEEYKKRLLEIVKLSPASVNRKLSSLRKYIIWATSEGYLQAKNMPRSVQIKASQAQEVQQTTPQERLSPVPPVRLVQRTVGLFDMILDSVAGFASHLLLKVGLVKKDVHATSTQALQNLYQSKGSFTNIKNVNKRFYQKLRPKSYLRLGGLVIVLALLGIILARVLIPQETRLSTKAGEQQSGQAVVKPSPTAQTQTTATASPARFLSFQGKLTDSTGNPITQETSVRFAIYNDQAAFGDTLLWEETNSVKPDQNGIFSSTLGQTTRLPVSVFTDNEKIWLGITIGSGSELVPRQQIPNVDLARNAQLLQGKSVSPLGLINTIPVIDSSGNLNLANTSSSITATNGDLTLEGQKVTVQTTVGSNGNIVLATDGTGQIDVQKALFNSTGSGSPSGAVQINDNLSVTANSSNSAALVVRQTGSGDLLQAFQGDAQASTSANVLTLKNSGLLGINTASPSAFLDVTGKTEQLRLSYDTNNFASFTVSSGGNLTIDTSGNNIIFADPITLGTLPDLTVSGAKKGRALVVFNETGDQNILVASASGTTKFTLSRTGNIGVTGEIDNITGGEVTIADSLKVSGSTFTIGNGSAGTIQTSNARLTLGSGTANAIYLVSNVGIGNSSPNAKLEVAGTGHFTGAVNFDSTAVINTSLAIGSWAPQSAPAQGLIVAGNIGVGTSTPNFKLEVAGAEHVIGNIITDAQFLGSNSGVSAPAYSFVNDTDSGLYTTGANSLALTVGGSQNTGININSSGNVGIGQSSPNAKLEVAGTGHFTGAVNFDSTAVINTSLAIGSWAPQSAPAQGLIVAGNVGIGTSSPNFKLEVAGSEHITGNLQVDGALVVNAGISIGTQVLLQDGSAGSPSLAFTNDTNSGLYRIGSDHINLITGGNANQGLAINSSGNVGIGNSSPNARLEVAGAAHITGNTNIDGTLVTNGTSTFVNNVDITTGNLDVGWNGTVTGPARGISLFGNLGVGTSTPNVALEVAGSEHITGNSNIDGTLTANGIVTLGSQLLLADGSAGAPSLSFTGDTDTGIFRSGANTLNFSVGGVERIRISSNGNLGIGSSNPGASLQVGGNATIGYPEATTGPANGLAVLGNVGIGTSSPNVTLEVAGGNHFTGNSNIDGTLRVNGNTTLGSTLSTFGSGQFGFGSAVTVPANGLAVFGNVGIGTSTPNYKLEIAGAQHITGNVTADAQILGSNSGFSAPAYSFSSDSDSGLYSTGANSLALTVGGSANTGININSSGNVGIGNSSPNAKLEVAGAAHITGAVNFDSTAVINTSLAIGSWVPQSAPAQGLIVAGNVGIGSSSPNFKLEIAGAQHITGNLNVDGALTANGVTSLASTLAVNGGTRIGAPYYTATGPNNGLIVSGNVGIGTSTPNVALEVAGSEHITGNANIDGTLTTNGNATFGSRILIADGSSAAPTIAFSNETGTGLYRSAANTVTITAATSANTVLNIGTNGDGKISVGVVDPYLILNTNTTTRTLTLRTTASAGTDDIVFEPTSVEVFRILESGIVTTPGNIGVGTSSPGAKLQIVGNAVIGYPSNTAGPTNGLAINGNLGIGLSSPNYKLEVLGGQHVTGNLLVDGSLTTIAGVSFGSQLQLSDGTASAPGLTFTNDTDSGLYRIGNNHINLITGGDANQGVAINSSGNVGIGNSSPNVKLEVAGAGHFTGNLNVDAAAVINTSLAIGSWAPQSAPSQGLIVAGNVGIGTSTPNVKLEIAGGEHITGNSQIDGTLTVNGATTFVNNIDLTTGNLDVGWNSVVTGPARGISLFGNLGVGTSTPNFKLEVAGSEHITGSSNIDGTLMVNGSTNLGSQLLLSDGTNSAPSLAFTNDTDTGLYRIDSNRLSLVTGGASALTINSSGNVGIGTTNPGAIFQVNGNGVIGFGSGAIGGPTNGLAVSGNLGVGTTSPNAKLEVAGALHTTGAVNFDSTAVINTSLAIGTWAPQSAPAQGLVVAGNIGIGTSTPNYKLEIAGGQHLTGNITVDAQVLASNSGFSTPAYSFGTDTDSGLYTTGANSLALTVGGSQNTGININSSGNVGIGTSSPNVKLEVAGAAHITGAVNFDSTAVINTSLAIGSWAPQSAPAQGLIVAGNVGIGSSSPNFKLEIAGAQHITGNITSDAQFFGSNSGFSAPAYSFGTDTDSGLYTTGANSLALTVGGSANTGININSSGNVGIGTSTPNVKLEVAGAAHITGAVNFDSTAVINTSLAIGSWIPQSAPAQGLIVAGNVGIGTSTPNFKLEVAGAGHFTGNLILESSMLVPFGSASAPAYSFNGDTDTGIFQGGANQLGFSTGGTERVRIDTAGNVGIGNSSPNAKLEVAGTGHFTGAVNFDSTAVINTSLAIGSWAPQSAPVQGLIVAGNIGVGTSTPNVKLEIAGGEHITGNSQIDGTLRVNGNTTLGSNLTTYGSGIFGFGDIGVAPANGLVVKGNVGIGTSNPTQVFQVNPTGSNPFVVTSGGNVGIGVSSPTATLQVSGNSTIGFGQSLVVGPASGLAVSGNLGIGTSSPNVKLEVAGAGHVTGAFNVDGAFTANGATSLASTLAVNGGTAIGSLYYSTAAPANGLIVSGNVGIGTSTPTTALEVAGALHTTGNAILDGTLNVNGASTFVNNIDLTTGNLDVGWNSVVTGPARGISLFGNLGVGTSTPNVKLEVAGAAHITGAVNFDSTAVINTSLAIGSWAPQSAPAQGLIVAGNIGIGTSTPNVKLEVAGGEHVTGNSNIDGTLRVNGNTTLGSTLATFGSGQFGFGNNVTVPANALAVFGNVGVGTSTPNVKLEIAGAGHVTGAFNIDGALTANGITSLASTLAVNGGTRIGALYYTATGPTNGLVVQGNVGIGTSTPNVALEVAGAFHTTGNTVVDGTFTSNGALTVNSTGTIGGNLTVNGTGTIGFAGTPVAPTNGLAVSGNVGIGTTSTFNKLDVQGGVAIGTYGGVITAPSNGLIISGNVGIGASSPNAGLQVGNNATIGFGTVFVNGPTNGLAVSGNIGVGTSTPNVKLEVAGAGHVTGAFNIDGAFTANGATSLASTLAVNGATAIGSAYYSATVPANSLAVFGNIGIGTSTPNVKLEVAGAGHFTGGINIDSTVVVNTGLVVGSFPSQVAPTQGAIIAGNVGIGVSSPNASLQISGNSTIGFGTAYVAGPANGLAISGSLGIGTSTPNTKLEVAGSLHATGAGVVDGTFTANGNTTLGSTLTTFGSGQFGFGSAVTVPANALAVFGNLGVGTSTPNVKLEVAGAGHFTGGLTVDSGLVVNGTTKLSGVTYTWPGGDGSNGQTLATNGSGTLSWSSAGAGTITGSGVSGFLSKFNGSTSITNSALYENGAGNIGIGTSTPLSRFAVVGSVDIHGGNLGIGTSSPGSGLAVAGGVIVGYTGTQAAPTNGLSISGNVGIGTSTPNFKLEVAGAGHLTGNANIDGTLTTNGNATFGSTLSTFGSGQFGFGSTVTVPANALAVFGNVGIGTSTPNVKFEVAGGEHITGNSQIDGTLTVNGASTFVNNIDLTTGNLDVGWNSVVTGPARGISLFGNLGVGTSTPNVKLEVAGAQHITGSLTTDAQILGSNSGVSAPAYSFVNDTDSGLYTTGANSLALTVGGSSTAGININSSGNVGIGTATPATIGDGGAPRLVQVAGSGSGNYGLLQLATDQTGNGATVGALVFGSTGLSNADKRTGAIYSTKRNTSTTSGTADLDFYTWNGGTAVDAMTISAAGNVGIGTVSPIAKLNLFGTAAGTGVNLLTQSSAGAFGLAILDNGNVGIGTTGPLSPLEVQKTGTQISGNYYKVADFTQSSVSPKGVSLGYDNANAVGIIAPYGVNALAFWTYNGTTWGERVRLDVNGNVGIGTASPLTKLDVIGNGTYAADFMSGNVGIGTSSPGQKLTLTNNTYLGIENTVANAIPVLTLNSLNNVVLQNTTSNNYVLLNPGGGNVGIGLTGPLAALHVNGSGLFGNGGVSGTLGKGLYISVNNNNSQNSFQIDTNSYVTNAMTFTPSTSTSGTPSFTTPAMTILANGNIGINTTSPGAPLAINAATAVAGSVGQSFITNSANTNQRLKFGVDSTIDGANGAGWIQYTLEGTGHRSLLLNPSGGNVGINTTSPTQIFQTNTGSSATVITSSGNIGVGNSSPNFKLEVAGNMHLTGAATFDSSMTIGGQTCTSPCLTVGNGTGKIDVGTVDPPYTINGTKYSTYLPAMVGQKEEVTGTITTSEYMPGVGYGTIINFNTLETGSDLWLFAKITNLKQQIDKMTALLTPSTPARVWYKVDKEAYKLTFYSSSPTTISYRLTAPRFDADQHPTLRVGGSDGFIINDPDHPVTLGTNGTVQDTSMDIQNLEFANALDSNGNIIYALKDSAGNIIHETAALSDAVIADLRVGYVHAQALTVAGLVEAQTITSKHLDTLTANISQLTAVTANIQELTSDLLTTKKLVSPLAQIDELHTDFISPLSNKDLVVRLGNQATDSASLVHDSQFIIQNASGSAILSVNQEGDATLSGTLRAKRIVADDIEGLNAKIATLSALPASLREALQAGNQITTIQNITNIIESGPTASPSAQPTPTATPSAVLASLTNPSSLITNPYIDIAPFQTQLAHVENLEATTATFTTGVMSFGLSSFADLSVSGTFSIGTNFTLADGSINVLGNDLLIQNLRQGGVSIADGLIYFDKDGNAKISGNLAVEGNTIIKGELSANIIKPIPDADLVIQLASSETAQQDGSLITHHSSLIIKDASGSAVLAVNNQGDLMASGSATFNKLNLNPASPVLALSGSEVIASSSAGTAAVNAGYSELTVKNPLITENSLIYLTPVGTPSAQPVFLIRQVAGESFTIGVKTPVTQERPFNWLIVN